MTAMSRSKGGRGEREVVQILKDHGWEKARRTSDGTAQMERGDIANGPAGTHLEIKRVEKLSIHAAMTQACEDARAYDIPVVVHRRSQGEWLATMPLCELLPLLRLRETG